MVYPSAQIVLPSESSLWESIIWLSFSMLFWKFPVSSWQRSMKLR